MISSGCYLRASCRRSRENALYSGPSEESFQVDKQGEDGDRTDEGGKTGRYRK